jgi:hypothetical protein
MKPKNPSEKSDCDQKNYPSSYRPFKKWNIALMKAKYVINWEN